MVRAANTPTGKEQSICVGNCCHYVFQFITREQAFPGWRHREAAVNLTADASIQKPRRRLALGPLAVNTDDTFWTH
jgi:hypothetical protein